MSLNRQLAAAGLASLLCVGSRQVAAAPPNGTSTATISGANQIFVSSAHFHTSFSGAQIGLVFDADFSTDVANVTGTILGWGTLGVSGVAEGVVPIAAVGKIGGSPLHPKEALSLTFSGPIQLLGDSGFGSGAMKVRCSASETLGPQQLECAGKVKFCATDPGFGHACASAPTNTVLNTVGGDWDVELELATDAGNAVTGHATVTLASANVLEYDVTGRYNPKTDRSTLKFVGAGLAAQTRLALKGFAPDAGGGLAGLLKFKIAGQSGVADLSTVK
jgi:hypothetical protein